MDETLAIAKKWPVLDWAEWQPTADTLHPMPVEVTAPIRFDLDETHASYDGEAVERFHRVLMLCDTLFECFSANFLGKISPVHFFWGSFDLCVTRFSGRASDAGPGAAGGLLA